MPKHFHMTFNQLSKIENFCAQQLTAAVAFDTFYTSPASNFHNSSKCHRLLCCAFNLACNHTFVAFGYALVAHMYTCMYAMVILLL